MNDIKVIADTLESECQVKVDMIVNRKFQEALEALRAVAGGTTKEMGSSVMRYLQVEEFLAKHLLSGGMKDKVTMLLPDPAV